MKDEIKEILKKLDKDIKKVESFRHPNDVEDRKFKELGLFFEEKYWNIFKYTLDYITNLEQELEELKIQLNNADNKNLELIEELNKEIDRYEDTISFDLGYDKGSKEYKSRIDKAMKLINKTMLESDITGNGKLNLNELLNILTGGDEE